MDTTSPSEHSVECSVTPLPLGIAPSGAPFATAPFAIAEEVAAGRALVGALAEVQAFALIGSALYLPDAQDVDFAVLINPTLNAIDYSSQMVRDGWGNCGEYDGVGGIWAAVRRGNLNLMVTHDPEFYKGYLTAMEVCKVLGLRNKHERVAVCQIVRDGKTAEEAWSFWESWHRTDNSARAAINKALGGTEPKNSEHQVGE